MREKKTLKHTMNSQVYNKALRQNMGCPICPPNRGCNRNRDNHSLSWKGYRNSQWKENE